MTFTNHLLAGTIIASVLPLPLAVPAAFASHFILDALPHFGLHDAWHASKKDKALVHRVWFFDGLSGLALISWLLLQQQFALLLVGFVAFSPDFIWIYRFIVQERLGKLPPKQTKSRFIQFHKGIQRYEFRQGWLVEVIATISFIFIIY